MLGIIRCERRKHGRRIDARREGERRSRPIRLTGRQKRRKDVVLFQRSLS